MSAFIESFVTAASVTPFDIRKGKFEPRDASGNTAWKADHFPFAVVRLGLDTEFSGESPNEPSLSDEVDAVEVPFIVTASGLTFDAVRVVQNGLRAALNRHRLIVPGWHCSQLRQTSRMAATEDDSVSVDHLHPWFAVDEYRMTATKEIR